MTLLLVAIFVLFAVYVIAKLIKGGIDLATTKVCSSCKERVKIDATKCRFCGSALTSETPPVAADAKFCAVCQASRTGVDGRCERCGTALR